MSIVTVNVACSSTKVGSERRFDKALTISALKGKLEMIVGASAGHQKLRLEDHTGAVICTLDNNEAMLGAYPVEDYMTIYVVDGSPNDTSNQFENLSLVDKQDMSEDEYGKLSNSVRAFKMRNKMGRFDPNYHADQEKIQAEKDAEGEDKASEIPVGARCEVDYGGKKRGDVMYVGKPEFATGWWVGVKYDEPMGKNDGTVKGQRYFQCPPRFGHFVRPANVAVGDYPEIDLFDELDTTDDEM